MHARYVDSRAAARWALSVAVVLPALVPGAALAQAYPERNVNMIVAFPAGGATDHMARMLAQRMTEAWGQTVIVLNRPGASGNIGAESVARAAPDGHTLLVGTTAIAVSPSLSKHLSYDVLKDLAPVTQLTVTPNVLVLHPSVPARSVRELIALAKARPGALVSASAGAGTSNHMAFALFAMMTRTDILHVPYKGAAPAITAVLGGEGAMTFVPINAVIALIQSGRLRALGVTTSARAPALPDVPTVAEAGVPGYAASSWTGIFAPAATPAGTINRIHATVADSLAGSKLRELMIPQGLQPVGSTPDVFAKALREEIAKWSRVVKATGIAPQ